MKLSANLLSKLCLTGAVLAGGCEMAQGLQAAQEPQTQRHVEPEQVEPEQVEPVLVDVEEAPPTFAQPPPAAAPKPVVKKRPKPQPQPAFSAHDCGPCGMG